MDSSKLLFICNVQSCIVLSTACCFNGYRLSHDLYTWFPLCACIAGRHEMAVSSTEGSRLSTLKTSMHTTAFMLHTPWANIAFICFSPLKVIQGTPT